MTLDLINQVEVSDKIIKSVLAGKTAAVEDMKTMNDYRLLLLSMAYDLNFKYTFRDFSRKNNLFKKSTKRCLNEIRLLMPIAG